MMTIYKTTAIFSNAYDQAIGTHSLESSLSQNSKNATDTPLIRKESIWSSPYHRLERDTKITLIEIHSEKISPLLDGEVPTKIGERRAISGNRSVLCGFPTGKPKTYHPPIHASINTNRIQWDSINIEASTPIPSSELTEIHEANREHILSKLVVEDDAPPTEFGCLIS